MEEFKEARWCEECGRKLKDFIYRGNNKGGSSKEKVDISSRTHCFICRPPGDEYKTDKFKAEKDRKAKNKEDRERRSIERIREEKRKEIKRDKIERKLYGPRVKEKIKQCTKCGCDFDVLKVGRYRKTCQACHERRKNRVRVNKRELSQRCSEYKGGKCLVCGYNKCQRALEQHHLDPSTKSFTISRACSGNYEWEDIVKEMDKCILLCSNCHCEVHDGLIDKDYLIELERVRTDQWVIPIISTPTPPYWSK